MIWYNLFRRNARAHAHEKIHECAFNSRDEAISYMKGFAHATWLPEIYKIIVRLICNLIRIALAWTTDWLKRFNSFTVFHISNGKNKIFTWNTLIRFALGKLHLNWMTAACVCPLYYMQRAHPLYSLCKLLNFPIFQLNFSGKIHINSNTAISLC